MVSKKQLLWAAMVFFVGCGPYMKTIRTTSFEEGVAGQSPVEKKSVVIGAKPLVLMTADAPVPDSFVATWQAQDNVGNTQPSDREYKEPIIDPAEIFPVELSVTNNSDQILRVGSATMVLLDPGGNQVKPLTRDELVQGITVAAKATMETGGSWTAGIQAKGRAAKEERVKTIRLFDPNMQVLPKRTETGFVFFKKRVASTPGTFKLAIYEMPTEVDAAGGVKEKAAIEFSYVVKVFEEEWEEPGLSGGTRKLIKKTEIK